MNRICMIYDGNKLFRFYGLSFQREADPEVAYN